MSNKKILREKKEYELLTECPNCGSNWAIGTEEYDFQECGFCGYPDNEEDFGCVKVLKITDTKMNMKVSIEVLAKEIKDKIQLQESYKILISEDNKFKYIQFYENDLPSVAYKFDKNTFLKIKELILK